MIVVDATVWRYGDVRERDNLLKLIIVNNGTGTIEHGNYDVFTGDPDLVHEARLNANRAPWVLVGRITDYDRRNGGAYLVGLALDVYNQTGESV